MPSRRLIWLCVLLGALIVGWLGWRSFSLRQDPAQTPGATINKEPATIAKRTFDPASSPPEMPPLSLGEDAECDSNFLSNAGVSGQTRQTDATHATVTITQIKVNLQLNVTIWIPRDVTQRVIDHEEGHRQISEFYYQTADKLAERIAAPYIGKQVEISGANLDAESSKLLREVGTDITDEYNKELNPEPTQLLYDSITDHSRNGVIAADAVSHALKNVAIELPQPPAIPGN